MVLEEFSVKNVNITHKKMNIKVHVTANFQNKLQTEIVTDIHKDILKNFS